MPSIFYRSMVIDILTNAIVTTILRVQSKAVEATAVVTTVRVATEMHAATVVRVTLVHV